MGHAAHKKYGYSRAGWVYAICGFIYWTYFGTVHTLHNVAHF